MDVTEVGSDLIWPARGCGMNLRLRLPPAGQAFSIRLRDLIPLAIGGRDGSEKATQECLVLKNAPDAATEYLKRFKNTKYPEVVPMALFVGGTEWNAGHPPQLVWLPEDCDPYVFVWMLDHLSANAWRWSGRTECRRQQRFDLRIDLTSGLKLVDLSVDGCQVESTEPIARGSTFKLPLHPLLPQTNVGFRVIHSRAVRGGRTYRAHGFFRNRPAGFCETLQAALAALALDE